MNKPRLFISETLDGCLAQSDDLTFASGDLLDHSTISSNKSSENNVHNHNHNPMKRQAPDSFEIERMEMWGVSGGSGTSSNNTNTTTDKNRMGGGGGNEQQIKIIQEALESRHEYRQLINANIKKARKVDKAQFLDDFKSGLIESKAFQHREQMRGRHDASIDDDHGENAYKYEE